MKNPKGALIMFDGPDGVGKTTQIALVKESLEDSGYKVLTTRSHGGTPMGELLRAVSFKEVQRDPGTDHYISMAIHNELRASISDSRKNHVILVDRSPLSNWAYQVVASGLGNSRMQADIKQSMRLFAADLVLAYEAPLAILRVHQQGRSNKPSEDYFESKPDGYYQDVLTGYRQAAAMFGATVINAEGSIDKVHQDTMAAILPALR